MKAAVIIGMAVAVGALGYYFVYRENETHSSDKTYHSHDSYPADPPTTTHTDPTDIFQKAFWKHPTPDDQILHAPHGQMRLCFSKSRRLLHATDSGGGFHPGAAPPPTPVPATSPSTGRLPRTPPPREVPTEVAE